MFFYLSFLRPPPLQATPAGTISITPQVANDLRTEPFDGAQDIFYAWTQSQPTSSGSTSTSPPRITKPIKLTTWRQSTAYKEIKVPLPPSIHNGQSWRLVLTTQAQASPHTINLGSPAVGGTPFPVMSLPILFDSSSKLDPSFVGGKQERVERVYQVPYGPGSGESRYLTITEQTSFDLDKKIWDSGVGLSSWIAGTNNVNVNVKDTLAVDPGLALVKDALFSSERRDILELGAGTGIVALTISVLRSAIATHGEDRDKIITTDLSSAMPLLEHNIKLNEHLYPHTRPQAAVLDWDEDDLPDYIRASERGFDAIVMADVTYNTTSFPSLVRTLGKLLRFKNKNNVDAKLPVVILGYKERDPAERTLWDMASEIGITFEKIGERIGAGGAPVEVWVGTLKL